MPRVRRTHLSLTLIEFAHALILTIWIGTLAGFAAIVVPTLMSSLPTREMAAHATLAIFEQVAFLGCGAGAFLLLTTLLMHLFSLRNVRATVLQMALLLVMTGAAVSSQLLVAPRITALLRTLPIPLDALPRENPAHLRYVRLLAISIVVLGIQIAAGVGVLLFVVRRWYRYLPERKRTLGRSFFDPALH